jgi:hypothetical protein
MQRAALQYSPSCLDMPGNNILYTLAKYVTFI